MDKPPTSAPTTVQQAAHEPAPGSAHWLDQPRNVKLLWRGFLVVLALTVLAEAVVHLHPHFEVDAAFGFNAGFGFIVCAAMIGVAKVLALLLKRPDSYYGQRDD